MDTKILLENGTNELEILEFSVAGCSYGINVAKIKELIKYCEPTVIPNSHPSIEGVIMPRDKMITTIDLRNCMLKGQSEPTGLFVITNFSKLDIAFHIDEVLGIHRITWEDITRPSVAGSVDDSSLASGIVKINDKLIVILDFEKIVTDISPETGLKVSEIDALGPRERSNVPLMVVEDSPLLNKLIVDALTRAGYERIIHTSNGQEAYDIIMGYCENGSLQDNLKCIITDIEMPQMDGHRLTHLLKNDDKTKDIPIVIFSSLVNEEMRKKGESLGADAQLSKPEIANLVQIIDELVK